MKVYTLNGKVLTNSANDKWLQKKEGPIAEYVTIGNQIWAAKDLEFTDGGSGIVITDDLLDYDDQPLGTKYFYTGTAADRIKDAVAAAYPGWHIPTKAEWDTLVNSLGRYKQEWVSDGHDAFDALAATSGWEGHDGLDTYGFNGRPTGTWQSGRGQQLKGRTLNYWTSTNDGTYQWYINLLSYSSDYYVSASNGQMSTNYASIRLIKDSE